MYPVWSARFADSAPLRLYVGRPESDWSLSLGCAMSQLGTGLQFVSRHEEALSVMEAGLSMERRLGAAEVQILAVQSNLASTYQMLGRFEQALSLRQGVYFGYLKLKGEEHADTLGEVYNYTDLLNRLSRFEEAKSLLLKTIPVAQRILGESHEATLKMKSNHARALYMDTESFEKTDGFAALKADLDGFLDGMAAFVRARVG